MPNADRGEKPVRTQALPSATFAGIEPEPASGNSEAWDWFRRVGAPKQWLAPLVDYSEPAFRLLCRRYGAEMCSTPMLDSRAVISDEEYRRRIFGGPEDRPLVAQLGGNDPAELAEAATALAPHADAVELNLGCPQRRARGAKIGAWLAEDQEQTMACVSAMAVALRKYSAREGRKVALSCKIRCFLDIDATLSYAARLEAAGCECLTVHGRTKEAASRQNVNKKPLANWDWIAAVKRQAGIPVISNGNIRHRQDVEACFEATKVDGVMSGVGALNSPQAVFVQQGPSAEPPGPRHPAAVAALYVVYAQKTGEEPSQVYLHLVGKLALLDTMLLSDESELRARLDSLQDKMSWSDLPQTCRPPALRKALEDLAERTPDFEQADRWGFKAAANEADEDGGWTLVWRDRRF